MSRLLEILGRAVTIDTSDLIWHWFNASGALTEKHTEQSESLAHIVELVGEMKLDAARDKLRLYLFEHPECEFGRLASAAICLQSSRLEAAVKELNTVYFRFPNNTMALYALGNCYERLEKEQKAVEFYQDCLKFKNYLQLPHQRLAAIYLKNGQLDKAIQQYESLRTEYPDEISALMSLGDLYIANADYTNAMEVFNTAILMHPDSELQEDDNLMQPVDNGQVEEALVEHERLIEEEPERPDLIVRHADLLSAAGATEEAIQLYHQAAFMAPNYLAPAIKLGTEYLRIQQDRAAAHEFNRAVEINDKIVDSYIGLATAQLRGGIYKEAMETLGLASAIQNNSSFLLAEIAKIQFQLTFASSLSSYQATAGPDIMEAVIKAHQNQVSATPMDAELAYRFGVLLMSVRRITDAIKAFESVLLINPTCHRARSMLSICLYEAGSEDSALNELRIWSFFDQETLYLHFKTALLYWDRIRFASTLINLEQSLSGNYTTSSPTANIAVVLQNLGILDNAHSRLDALSLTASNAYKLS